MQTQKTSNLSLTTQISSQTKVGLEFELEGIENTYFYECPYSQMIWNVENDGSLRNNGKEFIFAAPIEARYVPLMIDNLYNTLLKNEFETSFRTSIHCHVDCRDMDVLSVGALVILYTLYEDIFFTCLDVHRQDNIYCVPLTKAPLGWDFTAPASISMKYAALNTECLKRFGTVEFRHLEATSDVDKIISFVKMFVELRDFAANHLVESLIELCEETNSKDKFLSLTSEIFQDTSYIFIENAWEMFNTNRKNILFSLGV